jgi:hypothetical protein
MILTVNRASHRRGRRPRNLPAAEGTGRPARCARAARRRGHAASPSPNTTKSSSRRDRLARRAAADELSAAPPDGRGLDLLARREGEPAPWLSGSRAQRGASRRSPCAGSSCSGSRDVTAPGNSPARNGPSGVTKRDVYLAKGQSAGPLFTLKHGSSIRSSSRGPKSTLRHHPVRLKGLFQTRVGPSSIFTRVSGAVRTRSPYGLGARSDRGVDAVTAQASAQHN